MSQKIKVNPEWLIWSRKTLNYDVDTASKKLKIKETTLYEWECDGVLTYKNLNKLANLYDVSPLLFLNNTPPPKIEQYVKDYRTMNDKYFASNPEILKKIKHAKRKRRLLLNLASTLNKDLTFKYYQESAPSKDTIISIIKESLGFNAVKLNNYNVDDWIREFESLHILIFRFYNINKEDVKGYAFNNKELPIIGINNRDSDKEKIFSLFNEYVHLLIGKDGISGDYNKQKEEEFCNSVSSEILLPENEIRNIKISNINSIIRILSTRYNVSMENLLYRLRNLDYLTDEELEEQLIKRVYTPEEEKNPESEEEEESSSVKVVKHKSNSQRKLKSMASRNLHQNGHLYTGLLLEAYEEDLISDVDLSNELGVPHNVIPYLINKLNGGL